MKYTKNLSAACSLGLMVALGGVALAEGGGDPRVEMIELPVGTQYPWVQFSDQGDTILLMRQISSEIQLSIYRGQDWVLAKRVIGGSVSDLSTFGISDDGYTIGDTDFTTVSLLEGSIITVFPRSWYDSDNQWVGGRLQGEVLSGDGRLVGVSGTPTEDYDSDALLWDGESRYINLSKNLIQEGRSYAMRGLSFDGAVAVFDAFYQAPHNNIRSYGAERDVWVWEDGELTMVPPISASYEVVMRASEISGNGQAVIGSAEGIWYDGFGDQTPLTDEAMDYHTIHGPALAWIWTQETGTVEITNLDRFENIGVLDITDDAATVLGSGFSPDTGIQQFLWYRSENQFVMIDDLFTKLGITIDADWYSFTQISGDGSKLMGRSQLDGQYSALIVTIPVRKP